MLTDWFTVCCVQPSDDQRQWLWMGHSWSLWTKARLWRTWRGMYQLGNFHRWVGNSHSIAFQ